MKQFALLTLTAALGTAAFAESKPVVAAKGKTGVAKALECPVMKGNKVNVADATKKKMYADHQGKRYFFCCAGCAPAFKKNPAKYANGPHIVLPKAKKAKG